MQQGDVVARHAHVRLGTARAQRQKVLEGDVARLHVDAIAGLFLFQQPIQQALCARQEVLDVGDHDPLHLRFAALLHLLQQGIVAAEDEDCLRAAVLQLVLQFALGIKRVGRDDHAARFQDAIVDHDELGEIRHVDDGAIAFLEAVGGQGGRDRIGRAVQFGVTNLFSLKDQGRLIRHPACALLEEVLNRMIRHFDRRRNALVVALCPRLVSILQAH